MSDYTWGIDGYGRAHIIKKDNERVIIFCMLFEGCGQTGVWMLESQDIDDSIEDL